MRSTFKALISASMLSTALLSGAAFAGPAEFHPSTYTTYKQHGPNQGSVEVLSQLPADDRTYIEIGLVRIPTSTAGSYSTAIDALKEKAAEHGGNAIALEEDAKLFSAGANTPRGTQPVYATATAMIVPAR